MDLAIGIVLPVLPTAITRPRIPLVLARQQTSTKGTPWKHGHAEGLRGRNHFPLSGSVEQVIAGLFRNESIQAEFLRDPERFNDLPALKHTATDIANLPSTNQIIERTQGFVDRNDRTRPMHLKEVDPIGLQSQE